MNMISFDDFQKVEITVGEIRSAERMPETDKLLLLSVDFGEESPRQIVSGIADRVDLSTLVGRRCAFVTNLEPRAIRGIRSEGMILAAGGEGALSLLEAPGALPGTRVR